ncbi:histidine kinase N-terminal 7TM domain-containing protein [Haloarcula marina]|uniref:histidine kinase N-terminal 7TM domain-containing protein n=1 Tax=Haloarcula marina TaxID=2961574 RepID=UPI0020B8EE13|nr:histidine kinase N-terminal 7TM domain-containing protein [Halomicroarcula marina]
MSWQFTVYAGPTLFATVVALALAGYTARLISDRTADATAVLFLGITLAVAVWTGFSALKLLHTDPSTKLLFYRLLHVGAAALPPLFFLFALAYTDRRRWLRAEVVALVWAAPLAFVCLLFLNPDGVIIGGVDVATGALVTLRVEDGPGFLLFVAYSTVLTFGALGVVAYEAARVGRSYLPQAAWMAFGATVPIVFVFLNGSSVPSFDSGVNLVPTSGSVAALAFGFVVFRYRLFDYPPLAYTTAMKYSPDGMFVLDEAGRIVHANPSGQDVLDDAGTDIGEPMTALVAAFDPEITSEGVFEVGRDGGPTRYVSVRVEELRRGGPRVGWVVVLRDVTEQQRRQRKLERQAERLNAFASTVSHDLRNPLTVAQGFLELAQAEGDGDVDREALDRVATAHERMAEIIEDLLQLAKQGEQIDATAAVPLDELAAETWANVDTASATLSADTGMTVQADRTMLRHVFENLFRNAVEHGGPDVAVRVGPLADGFFVEDTGPGIPEAERESVLESGYTTAEHGTGYGLQIVHSIVAAHGWDLRVTGASGGGARFEMVGLR